MFREYFNKWKKVVKYESNKEKGIETNIKLKKPNIRIQTNVIRKRPIIKSEKTIKKIVPRVRINEKIRLLVSLNQKARVMFGKWKKITKGENGDDDYDNEDNIFILRKLSSKYSNTKSLGVRSSISSAKNIRKKRCKSDNFDFLIKERYNQMYSNIKKGKAKGYFHKIFNQFMKIQIPKFTKTLKLYKVVPKSLKLIKLYLLRLSFKDFVKKIINEQSKYSNMLNKLESSDEEKAILPSIKNIAASFIQFNFRKHLQKIHHQFRIEMLTKVFENLEDDKVLLLLYYRKWKYRVKKERNKKVNAILNLRNMFIKFKNMNLVNDLFLFTEKYADYINLSTFGDLIKKVFSRRLFNSLKLRFILCKFIEDDDAEFKKKYIRSRIMKKWNEKCKIFRRRKNCLVKIRKIMKTHCKKLLLNIFKLRKFKLCIIIFALKRNEKNNK